MTPPPSLLQPFLPLDLSEVFLLFGVSGFVLGWVAQRGNYCFVNAMTSVFTTKSYERLGSLFILFGITALGTGLVVATGIIPAADQYYFNFFAGWYVVVGALIFGFGATIAGGCNLSMLYRASSGYVQNWVELFGMMVGTYIFAVAEWPFQLGTMERGLLSTTSGGYAEYLPYILFQSVSPGAVGLTAVILGVPLVAFGAYLQAYTRKKWVSAGTATSPHVSAPLGAGAVTIAGRTFGGFALKPPSSPLKLADIVKGLLLRRTYGVNLSTVVLALDMVFVFLVGAGYTFNYLVITSSDGGRFFEYILLLFGINLAAVNTPWYSTALSIVDTSTLMVVMLCVGAFFAAYLGGGFKIRVPRAKSLAKGFLGGILVGLGVRIALGCNVGLMWTSFAQLGYDGFLFLPAMLVGVGLAVKVQERI